MPKSYAIIKDKRGAIPMLLTNPNIGRLIAHHRKKRQLTQLQLAAIARIPSRYLSDIETGRKVPQINTIARLAAGLGGRLKSWLKNVKVLTIVVGAFLFLLDRFPVVSR
ncbi:helix-turn-helix transcriptional regulator [Desulfosporosinus sp. OT]|uniref:helix-turn-helix domain-containing protein n=1 Tax=Desulfosporosinus sp. OT TaxID=913865 RepID=UPI001300C7EC|nr:helix-turn-helix transcriptional regulator [Desulfosporosinus sp. OT]